MNSAIGFIFTVLCLFLAMTLYWQLAKAKNERIWLVFTCTHGCSAFLQGAIIFFARANGM